MGAVGARAVAQDLGTNGHTMVELERYAMANKLWQTKVKRLRLPDLVCVNCGRRVESKAKTDLKVKLSDSGQQGREWHAGGLRDDDLIAFIWVDGETREHGDPRYFSIAALREAVAAQAKGQRKARSEGSELDVSWPMWVPSKSGMYVGPITEQALDGTEVVKLRFAYEDGKARTYWYSA